MFQRIKIVFLLIVSCFVLSGGTFEALAAENPLKALEEMQQAVNTKDYNGFISVVDVDSVVAAAMPEVIGVVQSSYRNGLLDLPPALGFAINSLDLKDPGQLALASQLLGSELKSLLATGISGGYFAGEPVAQSKNSAYANVFEHMSKGRKSVTGQRILHQKDDFAKVAAVFEDAGSGFYPLVLGISKQNNSWRVVSIENAKELVEQVLSGQ